MSSSSALPSINQSPMTKPLRWLMLSFLVIALDQISKLWAVANLSNGETIKLLPILDFSLTFNTGAAFGFLSQAGGWQKLFFIAIALFVSIALIWAMKTAKTDEKQVVIAYALIIGGAIGNLIDRVRIEKVVDFIHFYYQNWHFPYFNIADIAITIGAILMIMDAFKLKIFR